jgi:hypothetical protein
MEGDVEGIMAQPVGKDEETLRAKEKWLVYLFSFLTSPWATAKSRQLTLPF